MKIVDRIPGVPPRTTTLNDIPEGQVFRGGIVSVLDAKTYQGVFYKANGGWILVDKRRQPVSSLPEVAVVCLSGNPDSTTANIWVYCSTVVDYEPLDVELIIKGRL